VILIDARKGVLEQTMRHSYIATLLDIRHLVFCINKMDMTSFSEEQYLSIKKTLAGLVKKLNIEDAHYIPISAKYGDNVVEPSKNMPWYIGNTFLHLIETIEIKKNKNSSDARFPVQTIIRPDSKEFHDYRGYSGRVAGGAFHIGDEVTVLPSFLKSKIKSIDSLEKQFKSATAGDSVSLTLEDQIDIGRGDMIVKPGKLPQSGNDITLTTCWFNEKPLKSGGRYIVRNYTNETSCVIKSVNYKMNINTLEKVTDDLLINMNDIANISILTAKRLFFDSYRKNNITGSLIFIEEGTNETVAVGMIE
jgi:sulfate adenylyltransferase subunit 1